MQAAFIPPPPQLPYIQPPVPAQQTQQAQPVEPVPAQLAPLYHGSYEREAARLEELFAYRLFDASVSSELDGIADAAAAICETPIALVSLIDQDTYWKQGSVGIEMTHVCRNEAFCNYTIAGPGVLEVTDLTQDVRFAESPYVQAEGGLRFYAGVPITTDKGYNLGALCVVDTAPRQLTDRQRAALKTLARQAYGVFDLQRQRHMLAQQGHLVESMDYARRMQQASLPNLATMAGFERSFALYQPKDLVGGDFYWAQRGSMESMLVVGDCSGEGLPGSMVTTLADGLLDNIVGKDELPAPDQVLKRMAALWAAKVAQRPMLKAEKLSMGVLTVDAGRGVGAFAGAGRSLYIMQDGHVTQLRGDRRTLGANAQAGTDFTRVHLDFSQPTTVYMTTRGITDQLSPSGVAFGPDRFVELLEELAEVPIANQRAAVLAAISAWRGTRPQTDDLCLVGVQIGQH